MRQLIVFLIAFLIVSCADNTHYENSSGSFKTTAEDTLLQKEKPIPVNDSVSGANVIKTGDTASIIKSTLLEITNFDNISRAFLKDTFRFYEAEAVVTHDKTCNTILVTGIIFGEMGRTTYKCYLTKKLKFIYAVFNHDAYEEPYAQNNKMNSTTEYWVFSNGKLFAALNSKNNKIAIDKETFSLKTQEINNFFTDYKIEIKE